MPHVKMAYHAVDNYTEKEVKNIVGNIKSEINLKIQ